MSDQVRLAAADGEDGDTALAKPLRPSGGDPGARLRLPVADVKDYAIVMLDPEGRVVTWSESARGLQGYTEEEILGRSIETFHTADDRAAGTPARLLRKAAEEGRADDEGWRLRKDGTRFEADVVLTALRRGDGELFGFAKVTRDVSERKRAERERQRALHSLRESEARYRQLVEHLREIVFSGELTGNEWTSARLTFVSPQIEGVTGRSPADFLADRTLWARLRHREDVASVADETERAWSRGEPVTRFYRMRNEKTGEYRWIEDTFVPELGGASAGRRFFGTARDITERWHAEEERRASDARNQAILDALPDLMFLQDADGTYLDCHVPDPDALPVPAESLVGRGMSDVLPTELALRFTEVFREAVRTQAVQVLEYSLSLPAGTRHFESRTVVCDGDRFMTTARDVTERKQLESQFRQAQKMEAIGQLTGGIAHDFNNILGVITGYGELLRRDIDPSHRGWQRLEQILKAATHAAGLTRQLLAFSRKQVLQPKVLDLSEIVGGTQLMLQRLIGEDIQFDAILDPALKPVRVDPGQVEQIVMNLVVNARDAMPHGGRLLVETKNVWLDANYVRLRADARAGPHVLLAVSDTGHGMDAETLRHVFEPFFTTKRQGEGTGLGLATVYGIVKQSGGHVAVYSEVGKGTTFKVYFPQVGPAAAEDERRPASQPPPRGTETILLVEDSEGLREMIHEILADAGYTVITAEHPQAALRACDSYEGPIQLMLTDVVMPGMSGRQLQERLLTIRPQARVLFMSGYTDDAIVHQGVLESGMDFIGKPFTTEALLWKIREALAASH